jgi:hypothetical protein
VKRIFKGPLIWIVVAVVGVLIAMQFLISSGGGSKGQPAARVIGKAGISAVLVMVPPRWPSVRDQSTEDCYAKSSD